MHISMALNMRQVTWLTFNNLQSFKGGQRMSITLADTCNKLSHYVDALDPENERLYFGL